MLNCYQKSKQIQKLSNLIVIYNKYYLLFTCVDFTVTYETL